MTSYPEYEQDRLNNDSAEILSTKLFNLVLGGCILYGILLNMLIVILFEDAFAWIDPLSFLIAYFVLCGTGVHIAKSVKPWTSFLGYNLIVLPIGALLATVLPMYAITEIQLSIIITTIVVAVMIALATLYPNFFAGLGRTLFFSTLIVILAESGATLLGYGPSQFNWAFVLLFSLYIAHDWFYAQACPKTIDNAIDAALGIYLDIINLFLRLLREMKPKRR